MNEHIKAYLNNWINNAKDDLLTIERLTEGEIVAVSSICFHCQQLAEKYLKIFLIYNNKEPNKTHSIEYLLKQCADLDKDFSLINPENLTDFAVNIRYPDDLYVPDINETLNYIKIANEIKSLVDSKISIDL